MDRRQFAVDLARPLSTAGGRIERREGDLVRLASGGVGEATPLPEWTESLTACRRALDAVADAADAELDPATEMDTPTDPLAGVSSAVTDPLSDAPAARHAVELAALDAAGRRTDRPLAALLADDPASTVPVNATVGDASAEETVAAALDAVEAGFDCLKVKVGVGTLDRDVTRLRTVRAAVGSEVELRADANAAWDRETAAEAVDALASLDISHLEQPLPPDDLSGHADLRGRGVPIALDETLSTTTPAAALEAGAADVLVLKPMALGGPGRAREAAADARAAGVDAVVTTTFDAAVARAAAVHVAAAVPDVRPCGLATADALATDVAPDPVPVEAGRVAVPSAPGIAGEAFDDLFA